MRRKTLLAVACAVLVIGAGAYSVFWWIAAGRIKDEATKWVQTEAPQYKVDVSWKTMRVAGYPFSFRLELGDVAVRYAGEPAGGFHAPRFTTSVAAWNFHAADFAAPEGIEAVLGPADAPTAKLSAAKASGAFALGGEGQSTVWLSLFDAKGTVGDEASARVVHAWVIVPRGAPAAHTESGLAVAALLRDLALPAAPPGLAKTIDEVGFGITENGAWPSGPARPSATAWRDSGGTVELDHFDMRWGDVSVNGNGTFALDGELQPVGSLSGGVAGYDKLMSALVAAGRIKEKDARVGRLALALLAHPGKDGRAEIAAQLTIQDGEMRLGPVKMPAPRINW